jgi:hydroxypyruvate isomerase
MEDEWSYGRMAWQLRYASHLGYRSIEEPLFRDSVGSLDPLAHAEYAAAIGFSGVQYALARGRPQAEQEAVGAAMARLGLETGCVLYTTFDKIRGPLWSNAGREARTRLAHELALGFETAHRVGSRYLAVLGGLDPSQEEEPQRAAFVENLRWAAERAERAGMILLLESVDRNRLPGMLLHHIGAAHEIVAAVDRPSVRLIFDTAHIQAMDGDLIAHLEATWESIAIVQLADTPGRLEPGTGEVDFAGILGVLKRRGFRGLVELEFGWSKSGRAAEQAGLERLRRLDAAA